VKKNKEKENGNVDRKWTWSVFEGDIGRSVHWLTKRGDRPVCVPYTAKNILTVSLYGHVWIHCACTTGFVKIIVNLEASREKMTLSKS